MADNTDYIKSAENSLENAYNAQYDNTEDRNIRYAAAQALVAIARELRELNNSIHKLTV